MKTPSSRLDRVAFTRVLAAGGEDAERAELRDLAAGLAARPRRFPSKYFYDARGSALFEAITALPEYYLTGAERAILEARAAEIAAATRATELVELGPGSATKTRLLLDALEAAGHLVRYVPVDVSEAALTGAAAALAERYPNLQIHAVAADFLAHLPPFPAGNDRLVLFLGSTIGNLRPAEAAAFLTHLAARLSPGDHFLLGADLVKDPAVLTAAYDDPAGVTAAFNRNILHVLAGRFGADFDPEAFLHRAVWIPEHRWIEMRLVATRPQRVRIGALGVELQLAAGEEILTEISSKYDRPTVEGMLRQAGLRPVEWWTDPDTRFGLALAVR